ncbi:MAG: PEP-CTERM sorting domain-containing protein [Pirellulales bacterium]
MKRNFIYSTVIALLVSSAQCFAASPPMPGMTSGIGDNGMKHAGIGLTGTVFTVHYDATPAVPLSMISGHGADYTPDKFQVLEDVYFNAQYGWVPDGFISLPADRFIWIERTGTIQPANSMFKVYEAGNGSMIPGEGMMNWTMNEIYSSNGEIWQWDGVMQHDYYTADIPGSYSMSFDVYLGDFSGVQDVSFTPVSTTFEFVVVPEPTTIALAILGIVVMVVRRR